MLFVGYLPSGFLQMIVKPGINGERSSKVKVLAGLEYQTIAKRLLEVSFVPISFTRERS
jgi:hypothetical protein